MRTKNCIRCGKKAKFWSGHVLDGKKIYLAGWCSHRCFNVPGFVGRYIKDMGKQR